jgi:hypothetical protein
MTEPYTEKDDLESQKPHESSRAIRFEKPNDSVPSRSQDLALKRTSSVTSQNIIAYRTLSITVSEHEAKKTKFPAQKKGFFGKKPVAIEGT